MVMMVTVVMIDNGDDCNGDDDNDNDDDENDDDGCGED